MSSGTPRANRPPSRLSFGYPVSADAYQPQSNSRQDEATTQTKGNRKPFDWDKFEAVTQFGLAILTLLLLGIEGYYLYRQQHTLEQSVSKQAESIAQTQSVIDQNERLIVAAEKQATASLIQAEVSRDMTRQNEILIKAAQFESGAAMASARAAERSTAIAQDTFRLVYRPSLGVDGAEITKLQEGEEIEGAVRFKNSGQTAALRTTVRSRFAVERGGEVGRCPQVTDSPVSGGPFSQSPISVGAIKQASPRSFIKITTADVKAIESGELRLYVHVTVRYEGPSGGKYFTEYYARWSPARKVFEECDHNYESN